MYPLDDMVMCGIAAAFAVKFNEFAALLYDTRPLYAEFGTETSILQLFVDAAPTKAIV